MDVLCEYMKICFKRIDILHDSKLKIYKTDISLFETLIGLKEECKLPLPI